MEWVQYVDEDIATCLMTGIITDTGSFKYNASSKLFRVTSEIMSHGVDYGNLQNKLFNSLNEKYLHLLGYCLSRRMEILNEYKTGIITLSKQDYINFDIKRGDTEGIVNYMLMAKNIEVAVLITAQPNIVKFSFRSKGNISVQKLANLHFNGGGHENASGGYMHSSLFKAQEKLKNVLPDFMKGYLK
jgi:phosphoesterase RecJ-like protein